MCSQVWRGLVCLSAASG